MITYCNGDREAIITAITGSEWTVGVYDSFEAFRACQPPAEIRTFPGTPNRRDMLSAWPGWTPRVRDANTWAMLPDSTDDLPELPEVPASVSPRQLRIWLVTHGISMDAVSDAIAAIPDATQRQISQIEWEFSDRYERNHNMLNAIARSMGLTEEQVDQAFREASQI